MSGVQRMKSICFVRRFGFDVELRLNCARYALHILHGSVLVLLRFTLPPWMSLFGWLVGVSVLYVIYIECLFLTFRQHPVYLLCTIMFFWLCSAFYSM